MVLSSPGKTEIAPAAHVAFNIPGKFSSSRSARVGNLGEMRHFAVSFARGSIIIVIIFVIS